jgi:hypothetical protein
VHPPTEHRIFLDVDRVLCRWNSVRAAFQHSFWKRTGSSSDSDGDFGFRLWRFRMTSRSAASRMLATRLLVCWCGQTLLLQEYAAELGWSAWSVLGRWRGR